MTQQQQGQGQDKQRLDITTVRVLASLSVTRLIAVVGLNKHEKAYDAAVRFYATLRWFFLTLLSWYSQTIGTSRVSETRAKLFTEHYTHLAETLHSVPIQARPLSLWRRASYLAYTTCSFFLFSILRKILLLLSSWSLLVPTRQTRLRPSLCSAQALSSLLVSLVLGQSLTQLRRPLLLHIC